MHMAKVVVCLISALVSASVCASASGIHAEVLADSLQTFSGTKEGLTLKEKASPWTQLLNGTAETATCSSTRRCQNGGKCEGVCKCLKGTSGEFCEDVEACRDRDCGSRIWFHCAYNVRNQRAECFCDRENFAYDESTRICTECDCGKYGDCNYFEDKLSCSCLEGFAFFNNHYDPITCKRCDCGLWSTACAFDSMAKLCTCNKGFAPNRVYDEIKCQRCNCGENGKCSYKYFANGVYKKSCECNENFAEMNGYCEECNCGKDVKCEFNEHGKKVCHCKAGEATKDGQCSACDCGLEAVGCTFNYKGNKSCSCPTGFEDRDGQCEDVDKCQNPKSCPYATRCKNRKGTYDCVCAEGFHLLDGIHPKAGGCEDIDECEDKDKNNCSSNAVCLNTIGSYTCMCVSPYTATYPDESPQSMQCNDNTSDGWKTSGIVLLVALVILSMVSVFMVYRIKTR